MNAAFWILSAITLLGAIMAMTLRNLVHCVLALILFFFGIAGHYFLLRAEFLAAVQILIYVGAVAVLILFAVMLTRNVTGLEGPAELAGKWWAGMGTAIILGGLLWTVIRREKLAALLPVGQPTGSAQEIGKVLIANWVVPFEAMAVLLTAALIGAVVIALEEVMRRR